MKSYGQYCPISRSAELLGDRWTIHIVRDLLTGTTRFNEFISGNPGLSRALLSRRLQQLKRGGVIEQHDDGAYRLTPSGRDLEPVVFGLATWGARWIFGEPEPDELDPDLLLWWLHRRLDPNKLPVSRFTVYVNFTDHPNRYWIVVDHDASLVSRRSPIRHRRHRAHRPLDAVPHLPRTRLAGERPPLRSGRAHRIANRSVRSFIDAFQPSPVASIVHAEAPQ